MSTERENAIQELKELVALRGGKLIQYPQKVAELTARFSAGVKRLAPPGSVYVFMMEQAFKSKGRLGLSPQDECLEALEGILAGLLADYENGKILMKAESDIPGFLRLQQVLSRFHQVALQLTRRYRQRDGYVINDEYDVQDLLHALLKIDFDDIRKEDVAATYAGGHYRADFILKSQHVGIEVKKTREKLKDKEIGDELLVDIGRFKAYPDCNTLVCFVYDRDSLIVNPVGLTTDLEKLSSTELAVVVMICQH